MNCPACSHALTPLSVGELTVDACEGGCGGIWFDHYELRKVDEPSEALGDQLLDVQRDPSVVVDPSKRYDCPKCNDGVVMMRHFWSVRREITIDECPECGGIFLDAGELSRIRTEFPSEAVRKPPPTRTSTRRSTRCSTPHARPITSARTSASRRPPRSSGGRLRRRSSAARPSPPRRRRRVGAARGG